MKMSLPQSASLTAPSQREPLKRAVFLTGLVGPELASARGVGCRLRGDASIVHYNRCVKHTVPWLVYKN